MSKKLPAGRGGNLPAPRHAGVFKTFNLMQVHAIEEYAKSLDMIKACQIAGYANPRQTAKTMMDSVTVRKEIEVIHDMWRRNIRMTAEHASAKHLELLEKFEEDYDALPAETTKGDANIKGQLAGTLAKMSEQYMKATGTFAKEIDAGNNITINIDLGDSEVEITKGDETAKVKKK